MAYILLWLLVTMGVSIPGFSWLTLAHTLVIPLIVGYLSKKQSRRSSSTGSGNATGRVAFSMALGVTLCFFFTWADPGIFLRTRDYLLLSNPMGQAVSQWYYTHTPQAAEALKSPIKKQVKSCWIDPDTVAGARIEKILLAHGWLAMPKKSGATLTVEPCDRDRICLNLNSRTLLTVDAGAFLNTPTRFLKRYSSLGDNMAMFRLLCLAGLVAGFPLVLFGGLFLVLEIVFSTFFSRKSASVAAGIAITLFSLGVLVYVTPRQIKPDPPTIQKQLASRSSRTRINALRTLVRSGADILDFTPFHEKTTLLSAESAIAERYWIANALGNSTDPSATGLLETMTRDKAINVQCAAIKALARKGCRKSSAVIFKRKIETSPHWYVQQAAYGALHTCRLFSK